MSDITDDIEDFIRLISCLKKRPIDSVSKTSTDIKIFSFFCQTKTIIPLAFFFKLYVYSNKNET